MNRNKENNNIINKFLLVGDKFMPEMHLYQPKIGKYSACGPFTKHKQRIKSFMQDDALNHIYKMNYKVYKIPTDLNYDGFQKALASMVYKFFDKRSRGVLSKKSIIKIWGIIPVNNQ